MRTAIGPVVTLAVLAALPVVGCGLEQITQGGSAAKATDGGTDAAEAGVVGAGCGRETSSGQELCVATSVCPNVVVDTQTFPHCGFRVRGSASELVCACGESICSMGAFSTCAQASALLRSQTEATVCMQVAEERCSAGTPVASPPSTSKPTCDRQCLQECGQGAGCASICGC